MSVILSEYGFVCFFVLSGICLFLLRFIECLNLPYPYGQVCVRCPHSAETFLCCALITREQKDALELS